MTQSTIDIVSANLAKRYAREKRFRLLGLSSVMLGLAALVFLLYTLVGDGWGAFQQSYISLELEFDAEVLEIDDPNKREMNRVGRTRNKKILFPSIQPLKCSMTHKNLVKNYLKS